MMYVTTPTGHTSPAQRAPCFALLSFLLLLLTLGLAPHAARAATLTVTNTNDSGPGSLRAAIATANTDGDDTIQFSLPSGTYPQITLSSTLTITAPMTISGPDEGGPPAIIIDGGNSVQVFNISGGTTVAPVVLSNLVVADGNAPPDGQTGGIFNDNSGGLGGGIYNGRGAVLTLTNCTITDNTVSAFVINPNDMSSGVGGGLYNDYGGTVTLTGCTLSRNSAPGSTGGGLYNNYGGTVTLTGCTLSRNSVDNGGEGGGIYTGGTATLTDCTFTNNSAQYDGVENPYYGIGGGLCVDEANATLTGCTFDGNRASNGGGIDHLGGNSDTVKLTNCILTRNSAAYGGAIVTGSAGSSASLTDTLTNCTLTANSATGSGGGVYINVLHGSCILDNDILYGDTAPSNNEADATGTGQTIIADYCDIGQSNPLTGSAGDIDADPHFVDAPYQVTLKAGSPCIGVGDPAQAGKKDINGVIRFNPPTIGANEGYPLLVTNANASGGGSLSGVLLTAQSAPDAVITFDPFFFQDFRPITPAATLELTQSVEIMAPDAGVAVSGGNSQGVFQVDSGVQAILTGLTITGGRGFFGGGLLNYGTATLTGCTLTGNSASDGGGIGNTSNGALTLTDCTLTGNGADGGGAIAISGGTMTVTDCSLTGNTALIDGGAILDLHGALTATACSFTGNSVNSLTNDGAGGAICNVDGGTVTLDSDILYGDTAKSDTEITGPVSATYCDINQSGYTDIGDISVTPLFVAPPGNLQLQPNSPCIGKGDPSQAGTYDILGTLRPNPPSIGAYEGLPAATRTRLRSSSDSSIFGQSVTFTATVDNTTLGSHTFPAGSVVFYVNGIPTAAVSLTKVDGVPTAVFTTSSLPAGTDFVTASLTGNSQFDSSSSDPLRHVVQAASTSTALTTYYNPSTVGEGCYFTATVANTTPGSGALPTGSVAFYLNGSTTPFDTEPVDQYVSPGTASTLYTFTQPGTYTITAKYFGNSDFSGSSGSLSPSEQVNLNTPTVLVSANPSPSVYGQSVTFSVTVFGSLGSDSGVPNPTGTVTLQGLPGSPVVTLTHGAYPDTSVGSYTTSALPVGPNNYAAAYSGDSAYSNATVTGLGQTVNTAGSSTTVTSSQNPSAAGKSVMFTATIANTSGTSTVPTGTVTFTIDSVAQSPVPLATVNNQQVATFTTSSLSVSGSPHSVSAVYTPTASNFTGSNGSLTGGQTVTADATTTTLALAPGNNATVTQGTTVAFKATIANTSVPALTPAGAAQLFVGLGSATPTAVGSPVNLSGGTATLSYNFTQPGTYKVYAAYAPDSSGNFSPSDSSTSPLTETVTASAPANVPPTITLAVYSGPSTVPVGTTVPLIATANDSDGTVVSVKFYINGKLFATGTNRPFSVNVNPGVAGQFTFTAVATDNNGATTTSNPVQVTFGTPPPPVNAPPTVVLSVASGPTTLPLGSSVPLLATASDSDGTVASVKFYIGSTLFATGTTRPFSVNARPSVAGTYTFTAVATDNSGASTTSNAIVVTFK